MAASAEKTEIRPPGGSIGAPLAISNGPVPLQMGGKKIGNVQVLRTFLTQAAGLETRPISQIVQIIAIGCCRGRFGLKTDLPSPLVKLGLKKKNQLS